MNRKYKSTPGSFSSTEKKKYQSSFTDQMSVLWIITGINVKYNSSSPKAKDLAPSYWVHKTEIWLDEVKSTDLFFPDHVTNASSSLATHVNIIIKWKIKWKSFISKHKLTMGPLPDIHLSVCKNWPLNYNFSFHLKIIYNIL